MSRNKNGFTLVELLATIVVLSLVMGLTVYVAIGLINKSKEKSYKVTENNIINSSVNYFNEKSNELAFNVDPDHDNQEFLKVKVEDLVEYGYFSKDVYDSRNTSGNKVEASDCVIITRDKVTKNVINTEYLKSNDCNNSIIGDIVYTKYKNDNGYRVDINYLLVKNIDNVSNYEYGYQIIKDNGEEKFISFESKNGSLSLDVSESLDIKAIIKEKNGKDILYKNINVVVDNRKKVDGWVNISNRMGVPYTSNPCSEVFSNDKKIINEDVFNSPIKITVNCGNYDKGENGVDGSVVITKELYDLTNYKKLRVKVSNFNKNNYTEYGFGIVSNNRVNRDVASNVYTLISGTNVTKFKLINDGNLSNGNLFEIDISEVKGDYYIYYSLSKGKTDTVVDSKCTVDEVWLES